MSQDKVFSKSVHLIKLPRVIRKIPWESIYAQMVSCPCRVTQRMDLFNNQEGMVLDLTNLDVFIWYLGANR